MNQKTFGLIIIGDEILVGQRQDRHFAHFKQLLSERGRVLGHCWLVPDEAESLTKHLKFSYSLGIRVFVCGGIGATPDDLTRACAARAAGVELERHPDAVALIEQRFGADAYPQRINMGELPAGAELIPNPYNRIPGFSLLSHYFLPGFPEMAWPMAAWVLDEYHSQTQPPIQEAAVQVMQTPESELITVMQELSRRFPDLKAFSLPRIGTEPHVELGIRGYGELEKAMLLLKELLKKQGIPFAQPGKE